MENSFVRFTGGIKTSAICFKNNLAAKQNPGSSRWQRQYDKMEKQAVAYKDRVAIANDNKGDITSRQQHLLGHLPCTFGAWVANGRNPYANPVTLNSNCHQRLPLNYKLFSWTGLALDQASDASLVKLWKSASFSPTFLNQKAIQRDMQQKNAIHSESRCKCQTSCIGRQIGTRGAQGNQQDKV